ncbi:unnamed protein product [Miscanthus lutarioriparius]|uniref:60S ribosomal protein L29 n=1 Tax=Miscanthus lutarioriparius TaxID=422564 RepID=A0A811P8H3_9POAL|nr:unnamed protein product [Miscanthus lutarioriparius]
MAKSKNHTAHNQSYKAHKNGIKKPKRHRQTSTKGNTTILLPIFHLHQQLEMHIGFCSSTDQLSTYLQMDPKFLRNLRYSRKGNKKSGEAEAEE